MKEICIRSVIQYSVKKGLPLNYEDMVTTQGDNARSYATVKRGVAQFKRGKESLEDYPCPRRPFRVFHGRAHSFHQFQEA